MSKENDPEIHHRYAMSYRQMRLAEKDVQRRAWLKRKMRNEKRLESGMRRVK